MKKLTKILGILLSVVTVASMFVIAAPAAAATTPQAWNTYSTPSATGMVLNTTITAGGPMDQATDGAIYLYVNDGGTFKIIKSTNNGRTWAVSGVVGQPTAAVVALVCSPSEANVVFYATATMLYKSTDSGATFSSVLSVSAPGAITCLDVAKWSGRYIAVVGTNGAGAVTGGVYYWDESLPFNNLNPVGTDAFNSWSVSADVVLAVKMAATFGTDRAVVAVGVDTTLFTTEIRVNVNGGAWGATVADVTPWGTTAPATAADIAFPSDFNAVTNPIYFVSVADPNAGEGAIYRIIGNTPTIIDPAITWTNLDVSGAFNTGNATILAGSSTGAIAKSVNAGFSWVAPAPTMVATPAVNALVMLDNNYATNGYAYVLNVGAADGAFNVSTNYAVNFAQWSLINEVISNFAGTGMVDLAIADNGDMFLITTDGTNNSIWRQLNSAGTPWERVLLSATRYDMIRVAADYATSGAIFTCVNGSAAAIMQSNNSGLTFAAMLSAPGSITAPANNVLSLVALSASKVVVGSAAGIITTNTSAFWWTESSPFGAGFNVTDIEMAGSDLIAVATNAATLVEVAKSTDNGATWTLLMVPGTTTTVASIGVNAAAAFVAPASDYATTGNIFVSSSAAGLYRYPSTATAAVTGWLKVDGTNAVAGSTGLVTTVGAGNAAEGNGMVYVADTAAAGRVTRVRGTATAAEWITSAPNMTALALRGLYTGTNTAGNANVYTFGQDATAGSALYYYNDTLNNAGTGVTASNLATNVLGVSSSTVTWDAKANATTYTVAVNTVQQNSLYTAATAGTVSINAGVAGANAVVATTSVAVTGMAPGITYYVSVWANVAGAGVAPAATVSSFMFGTSFSTPLEVPVYTAHLSPAHGSTNVPVDTNFAWDAVTGATGYEFQIAEGTGIPAGTATTSLTVNFTKLDENLDFNTTYTWRVRAVMTGGTPSDWVTSVFTTAAEVLPVVTVEPAPTIPDIVITQPNPVTITQGSPVTPVITFPDITLTVPEDTTGTPAYIWIIVAIGALLTVAVVILIIRTRRVV
jgi:hypothetical protein